jgi:hypothetical protein
MRNVISISWILGIMPYSYKGYFLYHVSKMKIGTVLTQKVPLEVSKGVTSESQIYSRVFQPLDLQ